MRDVVFAHDFRVVVFFNAVWSAISATAGNSCNCYEYHCHHAFNSTLFQLKV